MKKICCCFISLILIMSISLCSFVSGAGYGDNFGSVDDSFVDVSNIKTYVSTALEKTGRFIDSEANFGKIVASSDFIVEGENITLCAEPALNYKFLEWRDSQNNRISTDEELTYNFADGNKITAVFTTDMILEINFDDGTYTNSHSERGVLKTEGNNKYMKFTSSSAWAINKLKKNGVDVYSNTKYEPNTTYKIMIDYRVIKGGTEPSGIISFTPHAYFYNGGDSPRLLIGATEEDYNKWMTFEAFFKTTDAEGMGESYVADGLFQTCACFNYEIDVDNIIIIKVEGGMEFDKAENPVEEFKYPIYNDQGEEYVILPAGISAATAKMTYKDPENYDAYSGETKLNAFDVLKTGDYLSSQGTQVKLKVRGDFDGAGVTVADVLKCVDIVLDGSESDILNMLSDVDENGKTTVSDVVEIRKNALAKGTAYVDKMLEMNEAKTYNIRSYKDYIKINGRTADTLSGVAFDYAAMGIKFAAYCEGTVKIKLTELMGSIFFTAYINGDKNPKRLYATNGVVTIAENLAPGYYEFEFLRQNDVDQTASIDSIIMQGSLLPVTKGNSLKIEVIGDSITSGCGSVYLEQGKVANIAVNSDATVGYAYLTAHALGADYFNFSRGARTLCEEAYESSGNKRECIASLYEYTNPWRNSIAKEEYAFGESADIVVINLGTNDAMCNVSDAKFKDAMKAFIEKVKSYNENAKIVWAYGMMNATAYTTTIPSVMEELGGADAGYFSVKLPLDTGASGSVSTEPHFYSHPIVEGHLAAAKVLTEFIKNNVL